MATRYFVRFFGSRHLTLAKAKKFKEVKTLLRNEFHEIDEKSYKQLQEATRLVEKSPTRG